MQSTVDLSQPKQPFLPQTPTSTHRIIIRPPETQSELEAMYRLRYNIYTAEGVHLPPEQQERGDIYDEHSKHWIAVADKRVVGTLRAILFKPAKDFLFITERFFEVAWPEGVKREECAEASRAAVLPEYRARGRVFQALLTAQYFWLLNNGVKYWIASLKKNLLCHLRQHCRLAVQELSGKLKEGCDFHPEYLLSNNGVRSIILSTDGARELFLSLRKEFSADVDFR